MKLTTLLLVIVLVQASAKSFSQQITLNETNAPLSKIIKAIKQQTGYVFLFDKALENEKITVRVNKASIEETLKVSFDNTIISYQIDGNNIFLRKNEANPIQKVVDALAPPIDVRGTVVDEKGQPMPSVTITVKNTNKSTATDLEGHFYLPGVDDQATLVITFIGYKPKEVSAKPQLGTIQLEVQANDLQEVVVAYGKTTQRANVGAVTVIKGEDIQSLPNRSVDRSLQGLVPGLLVTPGTGQPGGGVSNFVLRGIATNNGTQNLNNYSTLRNPLIVVDGVPVFQDAQLAAGRGVSLGEVPNNNPMATINPSDIESISVLKDAAAIALYGATASNGVILITTKRGKAGMTVFNYRSQVDISNRIKTDIELVTQDEYMELVYETMRNTTPGITNAEIHNFLKDNFPTRADGSFFPFSDLTPHLYNEKATTVSNELSMSGGNDRSTYYLNFEWTNQDGIYRKTGFDRKSIRFNFDSKLTNWLKIGMNTGLSYNEQDVAFSQSINSGTAQYGSIFYAHPLNPVYGEDGQYFLNYKVPRNATNPVASLEYNSSRNVSYRGLSKFFAEMSLTKNLKLTSNLGIDFLLTETKDKMDPRLLDPELEIAGVGRIVQASIRNSNLITTNVLNFTKSFANKHGVSLLAGQEARLNTMQSLTATGTFLQFYTNDQISQAGTKTSEGSRFKQTGLSYFGQANYNFNQKYFASASIRSDGYSQFGGKQPFNTFYSFGAAWIISEEKFMKGTATWLDYLKLRGSGGSSGNAAAINQFIKYQGLTALNYQNTSTIGLIPTITPLNSLIEPEKTFNWNLGLEIKAWKNRISVTADYYHRKTKNLIFNLQLPNTSGFTSVQDNLGDIVNKGLELSVSLNIIQAKTFNWTITGNHSINKNTLVRASSRLPITVGGTVGLANEEGRNINSFYMPVWAGVDPASGQGMWVDATGKPNTDFNAAKLQWVGKPQPDGFGSVTNTLAYRGLALAFQLYYQYGFKVYNADPLLRNDGATLFDNQEKGALDRWQKPGDVAANPQRMMFNPVYYQTSTRNLFDGDYIRLQLISLGYDMPKNWIEKLHLRSLRIYAQGHNLGIWSTKRPGTQDVSNVNVQGLLSFQYPVAKSYSVGINATF